MVQQLHIHWMETNCERHHVILNQSETEFAITCIKHSCIYVYGVVYLRLNAHFYLCFVYSVFSSICAVFVVVYEEIAVLLR